MTTWGLLMATWGLWMATWGLSIALGAFQWALGAFWWQLGIGTSWWTFVLWNYHLGPFGSHLGVLGRHLNFIITILGPLAAIWGLWIATFTTK